VSGFELPVDTWVHRPDRSRNCS